MNKTRKTQKLALSVETLRTLNHVSLSRVAGGAASMETCMPDPCTCKVCTGKTR